MFGKSKESKKDRDDDNKKPVDQELLDFEARFMGQGGVVIDATGNGIKELSLEDNKRQREARELEKQGDALFQSGKYLQAIDAYKRALEIWPDEILYQNVGSSYASMRQFDTAVTYYNKALEMNPNCEKARNNLAQVRELMK